MDEKLKQAIDELKLDKNINENFEYVYSITKESTIRIIRHYLPSDVYRKTDVSTLELDLQQEVYVAVYKYIKTLKDSQSFPAWIGRITANTVMTYLRKNGNALKMSSLEQEDENGNTLEPEDIDETKRPEVIAMKRTESEIVMAFVDELPTAQRDALIAFYCENIKIKDIAEASGVSENTIKTRLYYAKKTLFSRKADFKKHGIELTLIPFAVLIRSAYRAETSYAMGLIPGVSEKLAEYGSTIIRTATGISAGSMGAAGASAASAAAGSAEAGSAAASTGIAGAGSSSTAAGIGAATAAKAVGASVAVKATITVAAIASAAAVGGTAYKVTTDAKAETAMVQEQGDFANSSMNKREIKSYQAMYAKALEDYAQAKHLSLKDMKIQFVDMDGDDIPEMYVHTGWKGIKAVVFSEMEGTATAFIESLDDSVGYYKGDNIGYILTRHIKDNVDDISAHAAAISAYNLYSLRDGVGKETIRYYVDEYDGSRTSCALNGEFVPADVASEVMEELTSGFDYNDIDPEENTAMSYNELRASAGMDELSDEELSSYVVYQAMYADVLQEYANKTEKSLNNMEIVFVDVDSNGFPEMFMRINDQNFPDDDRFFIYAKDNGEIKVVGKGGRDIDEESSSIEEVSAYAIMHIENGPIGYITIVHENKDLYDDHFYEITDNHFEDIVNTGWTMPFSSGNEYAYIRGEAADFDTAKDYENSLYHSDPPARGEEEESDYNSWWFSADEHIYYSDPISYSDMINQYVNVSASTKVEQTKTVAELDTNEQNDTVLSGTWTGYDEMMRQTITYKINGNNIIEYTVDNENIVPNHVSGSTTFTKNGDILQLGDTENAGYLTGGGELRYENGNLIASDWGEDGSYEVVYTLQ